MLKRGLPIALVVFLLTAPFWLITCSKVDQGYRGAKVDLYGGEKGQVTEKGPGMHWYNPLGVEFIELPVFTQTWAFVSDPNEETEIDQSFNAVSADNLTFRVGMAIHYAVSPTQGCAAEVYRKYKTGDFRQISQGPVYDILRGQTKNVFSQYEAEEVYGEQRPEVINRVADSVRKTLSDRVHVTTENGEKVGCFLVDQINLAELDAPDRLKKAVQKKMEAQQEAEEARARLRQQEIDSQTDSIRVAQEAENNERLAQSISPELIQYKRLQLMQDKWDGQVPKVMSGGGNGMGLMLDGSSLE